jgi:phage tail P2-like protein
MEVLSVINLKEAQITDILPERYANDTDVACISYAVRMEMRRLLEEADGTRTMSVIDELPEKILDVLAVELRTPYYEESMSLDSKRKIIGNTLLWHTKSGTPSAVSELIMAVFGQGEVVEWFDFEEEPKTPGTFDIVTNARMTEDISERFLSIIQRVKNTRSHLRNISINRDADLKERAGALSESTPYIPIENSKNGEVAPEQQEYTGFGVTSSPLQIVYNNPTAAVEQPAGEHIIYSGAITSPKVTIVNNVESRQSQGSVNETPASAAMTTTLLTVTDELSENLTISQDIGAAVGATFNSNIQV